MWSETVGLKTRPVSDQKESVLVLVLVLHAVVSVLVLQVWCCVVKHGLVTLGHNNFSILVLEHHYCGDQQWRSLTLKLNLASAFVYFWWSWSCYFGLVTGLGPKNLVLFTSLTTDANLDDSQSHNQSSLRTCTHRRRSRGYRGIGPPLLGLGDNHLTFSSSHSVLVL